MSIGSGTLSRRRALGAAAFLLAGKPVRAAPVQPPGRVQAEIVIDGATGKVLHRLEEARLLQPASLTKLMTLEMLFSALEDGRLEVGARIPVSARAASMAPTHLGIGAGDTLGVGEAIAALTVHSCNDVAAACAEMMSGTEDAFAARMTARAWELGLASTRFSNASGLPASGLPNVSTARDLVLLGATVAVRHARFWPFFGMRDWSWRGHTFTNTNGLLEAYPGMDGGKTGYVRASGFHLFASAVRGGRRRFAVVAGSATAAQRDARMAELLDASWADGG